MDCKNAWEDTIKVWFGCYASKQNSYKFDAAVAEFLHVPNKPVS